MDPLSQLPTFCILPWIHLNVMPDSSVIPCCVSPYDQIFGNGKVQSAMDIWNSESFKQLRKKMLAGETHEGCRRCYDLEKSGFKSMRQEMNQDFSQYFDVTKKTKADGSLEEMQLKYIDIRFSNLCNFKCRGCGPTLSSAWFDDYNSLYPESEASSLGTKKVKNLSTDSPLFWEELKKYIPQADIIYFGGGEPLISKEHYEVLNFLDENKLHHIELRYTTNLSQLNYGNYDLSKIWSKFEKVSLGVSIDDIKKRAEYFRSGTKWNQIELNLTLLRDKYPKIIRTVNCTINAMNVYYLDEILDYLILNDFVKPYNFHINLLLDPNELRIDSLPLELKKTITIRLKKLKFKLSLIPKEYGKICNELENIIHFMNLNHLNNEQENFIFKTNKLDALRNESFLETYPELSELFSK